MKKRISLELRNRVPEKVRAGAPRCAPGEGCALRHGREEGREPGPAGECRQGRARGGRAGAPARAPFPRPRPTRAEFAGIRQPGWKRARGNSSPPGAAFAPGRRRVCRAGGTITGSGRAPAKPLPAPPREQVGGPPRERGAAISPAKLFPRPGRAKCAVAESGSGASAQPALREGREASPACRGALAPPPRARRRAPNFGRVFGPPRASTRAWLRASLRRRCQAGSILGAAQAAWAALRRGGRANAARLTPRASPDPTRGGGGGASVPCRPLPASSALCHGPLPSLLAPRAGASGERPPCAHRWPGEPRGSGAERRPCPRCPRGTKPRARTWPARWPATSAPPSAPRGPGPAGRPLSADCARREPKCALAVRDEGARCSGAAVAPRPPPAPAARSGPGQGHRPAAPALPCRPHPGSRPPPSRSPASSPPHALRPSQCAGRTSERRRSSSPATSDCSAQPRRAALAPSQASPGRTPFVQGTPHISGPGVRRSCADSRLCF